MNCSPPTLLKTSITICNIAGQYQVFNGFNQVFNSYEGKWAFAEEELLKVSLKLWKHPIFPAVDISGERGKNNRKTVAVQ